MNGSAGEPFFAAEGMRDFHPVVVYDDGQVVGGHAVGLEQDLVVYTFGGEEDFAADQVGKPDLLAGLYFDPDGIGGAGGQQLFGLFGQQVQRVAHLFAEGMIVLGAGIFGGFIFFAHLVQLFGGIEGIVGMAIGDQLEGVF